MEEPETADVARAASVLEIDLGAIADNYRLLRREAGRAACGAVVKADTYGLSAARVAPALWDAGCRTFFAVQLDEGIALRRILPGAEIVVLNGPLAGTEAEYLHHHLVPTLNEPGQIARWGALGRPGRAWLHVDTGMNRLGLSAAQLGLVVETGGTIPWIGVMSHLVVAEEPDHPLNAAQLERFKAARAHLPGPLSALKASLANSSGVFLGPAFHFDIVRPGAALYGLAPFTHSPNPMRQTIRLKSRILQVRCVDSGETVGYGATHRFTRPSRVAIVSAGYADGYQRAVGRQRHVRIAGTPAPVVGRVSMDLITVDVTDLPEAATPVGAWAELIGPGQTPDDLGDAIGTIGYELLTRLGSRYHRVYLG
jgi:alanine racemase